MASTNTSGKISKQTIKAAVSSLQQLPMKEKDSFGLREAIYEMRKDIEAILKKGYSIEEVAEFLSNHEIQIKPVTLKQYLSAFKRQRTRKKTKPATSDGNSSAGSRNSKASADRSHEEVARQSGEDQSKTKAKPQQAKPQGNDFVDMPDEL